MVIAFNVGGSFGERVANDVAATVTPTQPTGLDVEIEIPPGASASAIGAILEAGGVIESSRAFENAVRERGDSSRLKAGFYAMTTGMAVDDAIDTLVEGPAPVETFRLTVIEGLRIDEMLASIAAQTDFDPAELRQLLLDGSVVSPFLPDELPEGTDPIVAWEGLLAPDTFEFEVDVEPEVVLQRLADLLALRLERQDWSALDDLGLTPYDGLIIASLIEREAKVDIDRELISSVIYNRLDIGQALQIDATVIYAMGENPGRVLERDLEIDSPWNTYRNPGLPPTPIAGVRLASLAAAADPAETGFFYYVLFTEDGEHAFAETLDEHNRNVAEARANGILP